MKVSMWNPLTIFETIIKNTAFITNENKPSVRILIGRVRIVIRGFINAFMIPNTIATTSAVVNEATWNPGTNLATIIRVKAERSQLKRIFFM